MILPTNTHKHNLILQFQEIIFQRKKCRYLIGRAKKDLNAQFISNKKILFAFMVIIFTLIHLPQSKNICGFLFFNKSSQEVHK